MGEQLVSTGQAAKLCSVTPDTILKWIRTGRLPARRTAGGHHRIDEHDIERFLRLADAGRPAEQDGSRRGLVRYCWEFKGGSRLLDGCRQCVVYELRAQRCYEVVKLAPELGHSRLFCQGSCESCDYYQRVHGQATNVLVVTDDKALAERLRAAADEAPFNLELADCEYDCSARVHTFRPDFAVVDCSLGADRAADIAIHLREDPRVPFVRVILAGHDHEFPGDCDRLVHAQIARPFSLEDLSAVVAPTRESFEAPSAARCAANDSGADGNTGLAPTRTRSTRSPTPSHAARPTKPTSRRGRERSDPTHPFETSSRGKAPAHRQRRFGG